MICRRTPLIASFAFATLLGTAVPALSQSEMPPKFTPQTSTYDYSVRDVMIPMRDGVKLHAVVIVPRGAAREPMLLTRTPYNASGRVGAPVSHLDALIGRDTADDAILEDGDIRVFEDVRGKYGSEGGYEMNRPLVGPLNTTSVDHATDTYDTIDWLVKNVPESNGRVGMLGTSYDGFTTLMGLVHPHPALKAVAPINPMVDGWIGDDWFHYGAFRQDGSLQYVYDQEIARGGGPSWWSSDYDTYTEALDAGSAGNWAHERGLEAFGYYQKISQHPTYDAFWQDQAVDKILGAQKLTVPTLLTASLWDQEDMYGAPAVYRAIHAADPGNPNLHLVIGPWYHGQAGGDGSALGPIAFGSDTGAYYREHILRPFFRRYLQGDANAETISPVTAFVTGENRWEQLSAWPQGCPHGCKPVTQRLYLQHDGGLAFQAPTGASASTSYVSDPNKPVPFIPRPVNIEGTNGVRWRTWLVQDQRDVSSRPDVVSWQSDVLRDPVRLAGNPVANVIASTTGTDGDFFVKLVDVYPAQGARVPELGGYQLMISGDMFRGRYRHNFTTPSPIVAGQFDAYRFALPEVNHVFLPGHRMMVQIQSTMFPLYDRNPQTYVPNIFFAQPIDYKAATVAIADGAGGSFIELPVVTP
jgi:putative CocE/NonD family hydrolase